MIDIAKMDERLSETLSEKRYTHSVYVAHTASDLANIFGADVNKAFIAGLVHDCAKSLSFDKSVAVAKKYNYDLDSVTLKCPPIIHADIGMLLAEYEYGIEDCEILDAVRYHTIAREGMTLLDKILYVADMIEPMRDFPRVAKLREYAKSDIDKAFCESLHSTLEFNLNKGNIIHPNTLLAWNEIISKK